MKIKDLIKLLQDQPDFLEDVALVLPDGTYIKNLEWMGFHYERDADGNIKEGYTVIGWED